MRYVGENPAAYADHRVDHIRYDMDGTRKAVVCSCGWHSSYYNSEKLSLDAFDMHKSVLRELRRAATGTARYRDWKIRHGFHLQPNRSPQ